MAISMDLAVWVDSDGNRYRMGTTAMLSSDDPAVGTNRIVFVRPEVLPNTKAAAARAALAEEE